MRTLFGISLKYLSIVTVMVLLFAGSFIFREKISSLIGSNAPSEPSPVSLVPLPPPKENDDNKVSPPPVALPKKESNGLALYTGREPTEFRPVPEEVKLFTEEQKRQLQGKLEEHGRAVKATPNFFYGWIELGLLKKTIGDFEGARDAWEYASIVEPGNSLSFANLGELYWRYLSDPVEAEKNLMTSIKHKPDDVQTYVTLAELYHYSYKEKYALADDVLLAGLKALPEHETLMRRLAYLYEQRKEYDKSLEWWKKVLVKYPDDEAVQEKVRVVGDLAGGQK